MAKKKEAAVVMIQFIQSPAIYKLAYHVGESAAFPAEQAKELCDKGFAILVESDEEAED